MGREGEFTESGHTKWGFYLVALQGGDAHFGHHLGDAPSRGCDVAQINVLVIHEGHQFALLAKHAQSLKHKVGANGICPITEQHTEVMNLPEIPRILHDHLIIS